MALVGVELETLASEPDAQTTQPPPIIFAVSVPTKVRNLPNLVEHIRSHFFRTTKGKF